MPPEEPPPPRRYNSRSTYFPINRSGDYFGLEDADILPRPKPKSVPLPKPKPPPEEPPMYPKPLPTRFNAVGRPYTPTRKTAEEETKDMSVWERQAWRNAQRKNGFPLTEPRPRKITIWEKHAARKAQQEKEKEMKAKENQVVHSELPPPPRISLTPAFRAYKNNQESLEKNKEEGGQPTAAGGGGQGQPPESSTRKLFDFNKSMNFHVDLSSYDAVIGAIGGVAVGIESGFLSGSRIPTPNVPLPSNSPLTGNFQAGVKHSATVWRYTKRAAISGVMFCLIKQFLEQERNKSDWKNSAYSGFICGSLFGLRGGPRGALVGGIGFTGFATIAAFCSHLFPPTK